ncbi:hypothetical protein C8J57DRAFT_1235134 [Mycena rebaudengoi]|nr:hypothetical protein C8J57DRAFT_1235134 [Mycena rebaudengoi]
MWMYSISCLGVFIPFCVLSPLQTHQFREPGRLSVIYVSRLPWVLFDVLRFDKFFLYLAFHISTDQGPLAWGFIHIPLVSVLLRAGPNAPKIFGVSGNGTDTFPAATHTRFRVPALSPPQSLVCTSPILIIRYPVSLPATPYGHFILLLHDSMNPGNCSLTLAPRSSPLPSLYPFQRDAGPLLCSSYWLPKPPWTSSVTRSSATSTSTRRASGLNIQNLALTMYHAANIYAGTCRSAFTQLQTGETLKEVYYASTMYHAANFTPELCKSAFAQLQTGETLKEDVNYRLCIMLQYCNSPSVKPLIGICLVEIPRLNL